MGRSVGRSVSQSVGCLSLQDHLDRSHNLQVSPPSLPSKLSLGKDISPQAYHRKVNHQIITIVGGWGFFFFFFFDLMPVANITTEFDSQVVFSPCGNYAAGVTTMGHVNVWDIHANSLLTQLNKVGEGKDLGGGEVAVKPPPPPIMSPTLNKFTAFFF